MMCPKCRSYNEAGARFCDSCGSAIEVDRYSVAASAPSPQVQCPGCGKLNTLDSLFCESCGNRIVQKVQPGTQPVHPVSHQTVSPPSTSKTSAAWWLLPIFLLWIGGLIAFLVLKDNDKSKATKLLWTGIGLTVFWIVSGIALNFLIPLFWGYY